MNAVDLPSGERASNKADLIIVRPTLRGGYEFSAVLPTVGVITMHNPNGVLYPSTDEAKAAGIKWADSRGVQQLWVEYAEA